MKALKNLALASCAALVSCETASPEGGAASFRLSEADLARHEAREARRAEENAATMAQPDGAMMYQHNESSIFGTRSSSGVIRSSGPIQSYQSLGGYPVYPGTYLDARPGP